MPLRLRHLQNTFSAYQSTGVSLVQHYESGRIGPSATNDDPALYYVVPKIAAWLRIPVGQAAEVFLYGLCVIALVAGIAGLLLYARTTTGRTFGAVALLVAIALAARVGDVYVAGAVVAVACVPWLLWIVKRHRPAAPFVGLPLVGAVSEAANLLRGQTGTVVMLFGAALLLLSARPWRIRLRDTGLLLLGAAVILVAFTGVVNQRDAYLASQPQAERPDKVGHPLWHSVYLGFGYLPNPYVPGYRDAVGLAKARQIDSSVVMYSKRYEEVLRSQVIDLALKHPGFVAETLAAKAWKVVTYLMVFANVGLIAAWRGRKAVPLEIAFALALALAAGFGLLVIPRNTYMLGFVAFCALYAAVSVDEFVSRHSKEAWLLAGPVLGTAAVLAEVGITGVYGLDWHPTVVPFRFLCVAGWVLSAAALIRAERETAHPVVVRPRLGTHPLSDLWDGMIPSVFATSLAMSVTLTLKYQLQSIRTPKLSILIIAGPLAVLTSYAILKARHSSVETTIDFGGLARRLASGMSRRD